MKQIRGNCFTNRYMTAKPSLCLLVQCVGSKCWALITTPNMKWWWHISHHCFGLMYQLLISQPGLMNWALHPLPLTPPPSVPTPNTGNTGMTAAGNNHSFQCQAGAVTRQPQKTSTTPTLTHWHSMKPQCFCKSYELRGESKICYTPITVQKKININIQPLAPNTHACTHTHRHEDSITQSKSN